MKVKIRDMLLMIVDMILVVVGFNICFHYTADFIPALTDAYFESLGIMLPVYFVVLFLFGTYRSLWRYAEAKEFLICTIASFTAGAIYFAVSRLAFKDDIPFFFYLLVAALISGAHVIFRLVYRIYRDIMTGTKNNKSKAKAKRTMIVGCGDACYHMLSEIKISRSTDIRPVVGIDDDISKVGKTFNGLKVSGTTDDIRRLVKKNDIEQIIISMPSASNKQISSIIEKCGETGAEIKILPKLIDFESEDRNFLNKVRDITPDELLGRNAVEIVNDDVLGFIKGKVVLITGGGGSIGSELCRQVAANEPKQLIIVDIYENNAYEIQQELIRHYGDRLDLKVLIASVRDFSRINRIIRTYKPDLVIHAAAHKHVPLMEYSPAEAVKNNIFGTINVASASRNNGVGKFIMISTDKAVNPTNIMGATKRVCEMVIQSMINEAGSTSFSCVRFGNVLGSNGSVIPLFKKQIAEGGPVTVTHPDIIRYFMTIPEAVQLVLVTGAIGKG
ncbi:MAG: polysaccharide biosynthesis protein, partial [Clostridia bacterium]|nr:polysaccharide biosynthesis protein [Clostridia bacterium]